MTIRPFIFLLLWCFLLPATVSGQDRRAQLEQDKKKIEEEISYTNRLLEQTRSTKKSSMNELYILDNKIGKREELISRISSEIYIINRQITAAYDSVATLEEDLENLRKEYAKMIYYAFKNRDMYDRLMFIFAAEDFNQAYQRLKYFQMYNQYRRKQAGLIELKQQQLVDKMRDLEDKKKEKEVLLASQEEEKARLITEKEEKNRLVGNLGRKEKELQRTLREKETAAKKLQDAIEEIIAEEIRLANERAAKDKASVEVGSAFRALSPAEVELSNNFSNNKGRLPWPLERGVVSSTFGEHPHPVLSNVKIRNNGIDILTDKNGKVKAVFTGVVTRVINVPNNNNVVIIRHGEYLTVYSNLDEVFVNRDEQVTTGQEIGTVYTNPDGSRTELHFEIWQAKTLLNPQDWLSK